MRRREFITLLGGAAAAASAQSRDASQSSGCSSLSEGGFLTMLLVGLAWLIVMCNAGSRTARRAGRLHMKGCGRECVA